MNSSIGALLPMLLSSLLFAAGDLSNESTVRTQFSRNIAIFWNEHESKSNYQEESHERQRRIQPEFHTADMTVFNITTTPSTNTSELVKSSDKLQNNSEIRVAVTTVSSNISVLATTPKERNIPTPPSIFPDNPDQIITDLPNDEQNKLNHYRVALEPPNVTSVVTPNAKLVQVQTKPLETVVTTVGHDLTEESAPRPQYREQIIAKKSDQVPDEIETNKGGISSGVTALISTVGFAMFAVVSLLLWRRYQEYLHGNRELLVNDIDANDFNNFEL